MLATPLLFHVQTNLDIFFFQINIALTTFELSLVSGYPGIFPCKGIHCVVGFRITECGSGSQFVDSGFHFQNRECIPRIKFNYTLETSKLIV